MKNNKVPGAFYIAFGWVLGCYTSVALYFYYKELGLWILCVLGTIGLLGSVFYYHSRQQIQAGPDKPKKLIKDRIFKEVKHE